MFMFLFPFFSTPLICSFFRLKELFQLKNGVTTSLLFFWKMPKIWVARTTVNGEKKEDGLTWIYFEFRHMQLSALRKLILGVRGIQEIFFRLAKQICSRG